MFLKAAKHGELDIMRGVSANIMCGQEGFYGTNSFKLLVDMDKVMEIKPKEEELEEEEDLLKELDAVDVGDECSTNKLEIESMVSNMKSLNIGKSDDYDLDF